MDFGHKMKLARNGISHELKYVEEKMSRLEKARQDIQKEQQISAGEIDQIMKPELGIHWTGERAEDFFDERDSAHTAMYHVVHDEYEGYMHSIQVQLMTLKAEKAGLLFEQQAVMSAQELLEKGEAAVHLLEHKVEQFRKWIF
ncbi:hypothetical protein P4U97_04620 [Bacillus swezeyi]|uniref:hypothetical protein n=1 Tax=Bacillus swezeyi TaxID=1925020 RepID=UPI002E24F69E|nr:hypothetical protein [Bacillus swezeyi]